VWTMVALALGAVAFYIGVFATKMDPVVFMVRVPVPFIFGTIVVLNMMQGAIFSKLTQPLKGVVSTLAAAVLGSLLAMAYGLLAPIVTGVLRPGPPSYDFEIWLASALLGVTFPCLIFQAEFFKLWPYKKSA
jgi:hypothetical protein